MQWFGESWHAAVCEDENHVPTPVGEKCGYCGDPIRRHERGLILPFSGDSVSVTSIPYHRWCLLRALGLSQCGELFRLSR